MVTAHSHSHHLVIAHSPHQAIGYYSFSTPNNWLLLNLMNISILAVWSCVRVPVCVFVCVYALRVASTDKILRFVNTFIIIYLLFSTPINWLSLILHTQQLVSGSFTTPSNWLLLILHTHQLVIAHSPHPLTGYCSFSTPIDWL